MKEEQLIKFLRESAEHKSESFTSQSKSTRQLWEDALKKKGVDLNSENLKNDTRKLVDRKIFPRDASKCPEPLIDIINYRIYCLEIKLENLQVSSIILKRIHKLFQFDIARPDSKEQTRGVIRIKTLLLLDILNYFQEGAQYDFRRLSDFLTEISASLTYEQIRVLVEKTVKDSASLGSCLAGTINEINRNHEDDEKALDDYSRSLTYYPKPSPEPIVKILNNRVTAINTRFELLKRSLNFKNQNFVTVIQTCLERIKRGLINYPKDNFGEFLFPHEKCLLLLNALSYFNDGIDSRRLEAQNFERMAIFLTKICDAAKSEKIHRSKNQEEELINLFDTLFNRLVHEDQTLEKYFMDFKRVLKIRKKEIKADSADRVALSQALLPAPTSKNDIKFTLPSETAPAKTDPELMICKPANYFEYKGAALRIDDLNYNKNFDTNNFSLMPTPTIHIHPSRLRKVRIKIRDEITNAIELVFKINNMTLGLYIAYSKDSGALQRVIRIDGIHNYKNLNEIKVALSTESKRSPEPFKNMQEQLAQNNIPWVRKFTSIDGNTCYREARNHFYFPRLCLTKKEFVFNGNDVEKIEKFWSIIEKNIENGELCWAKKTTIKNSSKDLVTVAISSGTHDIGGLDYIYKVIMEPHKYGPVEDLSPTQSLRQKPKVISETQRFLVKNCEEFKIASANDIKNILALALKVNSNKDRRATPLEMNLAKYILGNQYAVKHRHQRFVSIALFALRTVIPGNYDNALAKYKLACAYNALKYLTEGRHGEIIEVAEHTVKKSLEKQCIFAITHYSSVSSTLVTAPSDRNVIFKPAHSLEAAAGITEEVNEAIFRYAQVQRKHRSSSSDCAIYGEHNPKPASIYNVDDILKLALAVKQDLSATRLARNLSIYILQHNQYAGKHYKSYWNKPLFALRTVIPGNYENELSKFKLACAYEALYYLLPRSYNSQAEKYVKKVATRQCIYAILKYSTATTAPSDDLEVALGITKAVNRGIIQQSQQQSTEAALVM